MFNKRFNIFLIAVIFETFAFSSIVNAEDTGAALVDTASLPINVSNQEDVSKNEVKQEETLVSPSKAQALNTDSKDKKVVNSTNESTSDSGNSKNSDFDFDLKMKSISSAASQSVQPAQPTQNSAPQSDNVASLDENNSNGIDSEEMPSSIQYTASPLEGLGNSILSQMDGDLFSQMSEIEKSTTLLTLELRREKIRNEIEAQKAIRLKSAADFEKKKADDKLKQLEKQKQIEAQVIQQKQLLVDKEKLIEVLKQRKLLNAYMNQMLMEKQEWLKEKENLYAQISAIEQEKRDIIDAFKQKLDRVLEASASNIQASELAKANFDRIVKGLKARNAQLRKRIEADAEIIKNARNSLVLKAQSLDELKEKNAAIGNLSNTDAIVNVATDTKDIVEEEIEEPKSLSSEYAILGITGRADIMSIELIDSNGQSLSLKMGSSLPTGHIVSEIGSDYAKFTRDGRDDYLYVGKSIDGVIPNLGLSKDISRK